MGTPQTLSNERGECIWEITQNTWGETLEITANNNQLEQSNICFQGQYYDEETGLHYNRYRYYEPYSARYMSKDPIGLYGGLNNSTYVSDPMQWVDPTGLNPLFRQPKSSPHCLALLSKIQGNIKELYDKRWPDLQANKLGLPERIGPGEKLSETIRGHRTLINKTEIDLRKWERRYDEECYDDKCEDCSPVGKQVKEQAKDVGKVAAGAGALYIGYRAIRFLPSLYPALWPTIPANLATP